MLVLPDLEYLGAPLNSNLKADNFGLFFFCQMLYPSHHEARVCKIQFQAASMRLSYSAGN